jgi:hypothetical protein
MRTLVLLDMYLQCTRYLDTFKVFLGNKIYHVSKWSNSDGRVSIESNAWIGIDVDRCRSVVHGPVLSYASCFQGAISGVEVAL